jgi:hypothetical protein
MVGEGRIGRASGGPSPGRANGGLNTEKPCQAPFLHWSVVVGSRVSAAEMFNAPPTVGQGFVTTGVLYNWVGVRKGAPIGNVRALCTVTNVTPTNIGGSIWTHCDVALVPAGRIEVSGPLNLTAAANNVPVVGGTGAYVGAQGVVTHRNIGSQNSNNSADVIHLTN